MVVVATAGAVMEDGVEDVERATLTAVKASEEVAMEARALGVVVGKVADTEATGVATECGSPCST